MNHYIVNIEVKVKDKFANMNLAVAAIDHKEVVELRFIEDILGDEYYRITRGAAVETLPEEMLDELCFHSKTKIVCHELAENLVDNFSDRGDVCFGMLADGVFTEL